MQNWLNDKKSWLTAASLFTGMAGGSQCFPNASDSSFSLYDWHTFEEYFDDKLLPKSVPSPYLSKKELKFAFPPTCKKFSWVLQKGSEARKHTNLHNLHLWGRPWVHAHRSDKADVHPKATVCSGTLETHKNAISHRRPSGITPAAIGTPFIGILCKESPQSSGKSRVWRHFRGEKTGWR